MSSSLISHSSPPASLYSPPRRSLRSSPPASSSTSSSPSTSFPSLDSRHSSYAPDAFGYSYPSGASEADTETDAASDLESELDTLAPSSPVGSPSVVLARTESELQIQFEHHEHIYAESDEESDPDGYLSQLTPTPAKHVFQLGPSLPVTPSSKLSGSAGPTTETQTAEQGRRSVSASRAQAAHATQQHHHQQEPRRASIMVKIEDVDATPRPPASRFSPPPRLAPAPRSASWRENRRPLSQTGTATTTGSGFLPQHRRVRSLAPLNIPSTPLSSTSSVTFSPIRVILSLIAGVLHAIMHPRSIRRGVPRPILRLALFAFIAYATVSLLSGGTAVAVPTVPLDASVGFAAGLNLLRSRKQPLRLAVGADGRAYIPNANEDTSEGYVPVQARSAAMLARAAKPTTTRATAVLPLPPTHELLALQSYLLQSAHNALPAHIDPLVPLDAHLLVPYAASRRGAGGAKRILADSKGHASSAHAVHAGEKWLRELEREREEDIVLWTLGASGAGAAVGAKQAEEERAVRARLAEVHGPKRTLSVVGLAGRADRSAVLAVLRRLGLVQSGEETQGVMVLLGNEVVSSADLLAMKEEELVGRMRTAGWVEDAAEKARRGRKARKITQAKWEKKKGKQGKQGGKDVSGKDALQAEVERVLQGAGVREA